MPHELSETYYHAEGSTRVQVADDIAQRILDVLTTYEALREPWNLIMKDRLRREALGVLRHYGLECS